MSDLDRPTRDAQIELTTTRTSGRSARVAALAIGALLVAIVYVGTTGSRSESSVAEVPTPAVPVAVATLPTAVPDVSTPVGSAPADTTSPRPPPPATPAPVANQPTSLTFPNEAYTLTLRAGERTVNAQMQVVQPGIVSGLLLVPRSFRGDAISLDISARPQGDPLLGLLPVSSFDMVVPRRAKLQGPEQALDAVVLGSPSSSGIIGIESNGYRVTATYLVIDETRAINVVLFVNANRQPRQELDRRWVTGDDGLVGWPSALSRTTVRRRPSR